MRMGLLGKLFGKKAGEAAPTVQAPAGAHASASTGGEFIVAYDSSGREVRIPKREWVDKVLVGNLEDSRSDPDKLYGLLTTALEDGFALEITPYAEHLARVDPQAWRGAAVLGVVYLQTDRVEEARHVLERYVEQHGANGYVLTNLAKVYWKQGDQARGDATLWRALQADPNQKNALDIYFADAARSGGEAAGWEATHRVAALPGSWLARSWMAWADVNAGRHCEGIERYREVLAMAPRPASAELLEKMIAVLGSRGLAADAVQLAAPCFEASVHGLGVGGNLLKANVELGRFDEAMALVASLRALNRPDYAQGLYAWEAEIERLRQAAG